MARKGGSVGLVLLVVVMAVVLLLVAQAWKRVAPTALAVGPDGTPTATIGDGESGELPDLQDARAGADAHSADVEDALDQIDD